MYLFRCTSDEQRTLALGLQSVLVRLLGSVPGPIIVGALFDSSCLYWREEECGGRGNCWVYDNDDLSLRMFGTTVGVRVMSVIIAFCAWIFFDITFCDCYKVKEQKNFASGEEMTAINDHPTTNAHTNKTSLAN